LAALLVLLLVMIAWAGPFALLHHREPRLESLAAWVVVAAAVVVPPWLVYRQRTLRTAQASFDETRRRFNAVTRVGDELVWELDADGTITYMSPVVEHLLGYAPDELAGQDVMTVLSPHEHKRATLLIQSSVERAQGWSDQRYVFLTKDGKEKLLISNGLLHVGPSNTVHGFTGTVRRPDADDTDTLEVQRLRARVRRVMSSSAFHSVYQPIIDVTTGQAIGAEGLTRFTTEPQQGPDRWFDDAASVGLGVELELAALTSVLRGAPELPEALYVSVNLSPSALADDALLPILGESGWPLSRLVIEITEHVSVKDYDALRATIESLREQGARLAVDDAGAGYASFRHILRLAPDYIKLDRTLIDGMESDPAQRALVNAVGAFASEIGAVVIAEGIETAAELALCHQMGVGAAQGYYIARPARLSPSWGPSAECMGAVGL
jgi:PAS domain S-box-containing protein